MSYILTKRMQTLTKYEKNKPFILQWRINNKKKFNDYQRIMQRKYDNWKSIKKIYLNILLEQNENDLGQ